MLLFRSFKLAALAALSAALLAGCTLRPAYQADGQAQANFDITYAEPDTRLEQIVIQKIRFDLGETKTAAYKLDLGVSASARSLFKAGSQFARNEKEMKATVSYKLIDVNTEETVLSGSRFATATYQTSGQLVADKAAVQDAEKRASEAAAKLVEIDLLQFFNEANTQ
ncbi:hypothetical protein [Maritalea myrionectae]|uniref:LPS-assembly lipoprotein LptE n=1 Tax=Maritalea myrionectae TaxID=454601 RepID=A0A2R4MA11_9HYPH|nr:hypothetical protein [Maritalea myrionectae]AVX02852.1 hypothetical protein MXMO3_00304 [Maritalea myrionectae]